MASTSLFDIRPRPPLEAAKVLLAAAELPTGDLTDEHCRDFFFVGTSEYPLGVVGVEIFDDVALLRSLAVRSDRRSNGAGSALVEHAEGHARARGVRSLFLLTTTAEDFFARRGYVRVPRDAAPQAISTTREFAGICPASSALMTKSL